ncbi:MAG TPA: hypothetical protein VF920_02445 [Dongiaceae bacterium]
MILDSTNLFSNQQAVTTSANSTNVIDLVAARDLGPGYDINFFIAVTQDVAAAGAATVQFALVTADSADLLTNPIVLMQSDAIGKAALTAGTQVLRTAVPVSRAAGKRYLGVTYTVATGPLTAGKFVSGLAFDLQANVAYPEGLNVSGF